MPVRIGSVERRASRGRPTKDSEPPKTKVEWRIDVKMEFNETLAEELANEHDISVIVTGLPFADEDAENLRNGATTDTVLRLYLDQCKVEHTYRLMKSGMGVDTVYVQTPSRAMLLVVAIAILVLSIMDTMLRRNNERYRTVRRACNDLRDVTLEYRHDEDAVSLIGCEGSTEKAFDYLDGIGMDPSKILDRFDG